MAQTEKHRLGDILLQTGVINEDQLNKALKLQQQTGCQIGEAIVRLNFASE